MVTPLSLPSTSREYLHIPVTGTPALDTPPYMAFTTTPNPPTEDAWLPAAWHEGTARILIGPDGGATQLAPGTYRVWVRFTAGPERPARKAGLLIIT
jgi:hypothetical protein